MAAHLAMTGGSSATGGATPQPGPRLPIVPHLRANVGEAEREDIERLAERLLADEPTLGATFAFGPKVSAGFGPWPCFLLEDHSAISLFERAGDLSYSYRALLLAGDGDLVAIGVARSPGFEAYCRDLLGLGKSDVLSPRPANRQTPLTVRCANDGRMLQRIADSARQSGGLNVIPYMGTGNVWVLAGKISDLSGVAVHVAAPPPRLTQRVNDKLWFAAQVAELFGPQAVPSSHAAFGLAALAGRTATLAKTHAAVAIKVTDSASSAGNIVLDSTEVQAYSLKDLRRKLHRLLRRVGWRGRLPLMATAWESPIVASPSVQLWIAGRETGEIAIEGIFDQFVTGKTRVFRGAAPTSLAPHWQQRIADQAAKLGLLFQNLGYFGRCSFDAILVGPSEAAAQLHWIECNGRWGGTSIPMTLANRLVGDWRHRPFVVIERDDLVRPGQDIGAFLDQIHGELFVPGKQQTGAVLLSPSRIESGTGFEIMVLGDSLRSAQEQAKRLGERLAPPNGEP
jgi:hypothetical protein